MATIKTTPRPIDPAETAQNTAKLLKNTAKKAGANPSQALEVAMAAATLGVRSDQPSRED